MDVTSDSVATAATRDREKDIVITRLLKKV